MVFCCLFGVRISVIFRLIYVHYTLSGVRMLSGHLLGNSCPLDWPFVLIVFCVFVFLLISHFGFESGDFAFDCPSSRSFLFYYFYLNLTRIVHCPLKHEE